MLLAIPLAVTGTTYALFTQQLSISATASKPAYSASQDLSLSYGKTVSQDGSDYTYTINPMTVKNNGTGTIDSWRATFDLPFDGNGLVCTDAICTQVGQTVTAVNTGTNGTIDSGNTATFNFSFHTSVAYYVLQNLTVSGTLAPVYQTMSGLGVGAVAGSSTHTGSWYDWPYTITVTNNTGQAISGWRIRASWDTSTNHVSNMPGTVNYVEAPTQLTILSTAGLADGSSIEFVPTLGSTSSGWVLSGYTVEGSL